MKPWHYVILTLAAIALVAVVGGSVFVWAGLFDVAATQPHSRLSYWVLHTVAIQSIERQSASIVVPDLTRPDQAAIGAKLFADNCAQCHGAPGVAPADFAKGLEPEPPPLMGVGRDWSPRALFWTIAHGIKMTGMPAWEFRLSEDELWAVVAFIRRMSDLTSEDYAALTVAGGNVARQPDKREWAERKESGARRGLTALQQYDCASCHDIPGLSEATGRVGPPLDGVARRQYLAGILANTPRNMAEWIRHPQELKAHEMMPNMNVTEKDARDMVAYLETLN